MYSQVLSNGIYYISSLTDDQNLLSRMLEGYDARMIDSGNFSDQQWEFIHLENDIYTIKNKNTNRYLEVKEGKCADNVNVITGENKGNADQKWKIFKNIDTTYTLVPTHCLSRAICRKSGVLNANVSISLQREADKHQKWKIQLVKTTKEIITSTVKELNINVYPMPFSSDFTIRSEENLKGSQIKLIDLSGKVVYDTLVNQNIMNINIPTELIQSGIYFIHINGNDKTKVKQVIKR